MRFRLQLGCVVACVAFTLAANGQERGVFEASMGMSFLGPANQTMQQMRVHGFDYSRYNTFIDKYIEAPSRNMRNFSASLGYTHFLDRRFGIGGVAGFAMLGEVSGSSDQFTSLYVRYQNVVTAAFFAYRPVPRMEFRIGPGLMISSANDVTSPYRPVTRYTKANPGAMGGARVALWKSRSTRGLLGLDYYWAPKATMGPYTTSGLLGDVQTLPAGKYNFSHLSVTVGVGFHIWGKSRAPFPEHLDAHQAEPTVQRPRQRSGAPVDTASWKPHFTRAAWEALALNKGKGREYLIWVRDLDGQVHRKGRLTGVADTSLRILRFADGVAFKDNIPVNEIGSIQLRSKNRIRVGALVGFLVGAAGGALVGLVSASDCEGFCLLTTGAAAGGSAALFGVAGAVVGVSVASARVQLPIRGRQDKYARYRDTLRSLLRSKH